jgi:hypothetical protein
MGLGKPAELPEPSRRQQRWRSESGSAMIAGAPKEGRKVSETDPAPLLCARCATELEPGSGNFYRVLIEAVADPSPPVMANEETAEEIRRQINELLAQLRDVSAEEALDQVYRRLVLYLCGNCYREWIENPIGD